MPRVRIDQTPQVFFVSSTVFGKLLGELSPPARDRKLVGNDHRQFSVAGQGWAMRKFHVSFLTVDAGGTRQSVYRSASFRDNLRTIVTSIQDSGTTRA